MNHPTPTIVCSRSGFGSSADIIDAFVRHLRSLDLSETRFFKDLREARHLLIWLDLCGIPLQAIDDAELCAFRRHDCHCPSMEGERLQMSGSIKRAFLTGALKLVQFLEDQGCIRHLDELDSNLSHLKYFLARCKKDGFSLSSLDIYEGSCRHILIWLHRARISVTDFDVKILDRFLRHDCVCPGPFRSPRPRLRGDRYEYPFLTFLQYLAEIGVVSVETITPESETDLLLRPFEEWLRYHRGIGEQSIRNHSRGVAMLVSALGPDPRSYDAAGIRAALLSHYAGVSRGGAAHLAGSMRMYLRYLTSIGVCSVNRHSMVTHYQRPTVTQLQEGGTGGEVSEILFFSAKSKRRPSLIYPMQIIPVCLSIVARRKGVSATRRGGSNWTPISLLVGHPCKLFHICSPTLVDAVPTAANWRLTSLPRYISPDQVEHVIACCDVTKPAGLRDKAILLLLSRLALRAGDIVGLRLADIDWRNALVRVCGKSRRQEALPLPQDVGDAILTYIEKSRPRVSEDRVFLRVLAPHRRLGSSCAVSSIVISALKRAGLEDVRPQGAHLFRHSAATNMLRSGQSLEVISALLRYKSMDTTTVYAKTDAPMLLEVAQPWIGDPS